MIVRSICIGLVGSISMAVSRQNYVILWIRINESILFRHPICRKGYVAQIILSYSVVLEVPRMEGWNHSYMIIQMGWWDDMAFTPKPSACMKGFTVSNCGVLIVKETAMFRHYLTKKTFLVIRQFHIMSNGYHIESYLLIYLDLHQYQPIFVAKRCNYRDLDISEYQYKQVQTHFHVSTRSQTEIC